jgi:hypothetical protein
MLVVDPERRLSVKQILHHRWMLQVLFSVLVISKFEVSVVCVTITPSHWILGNFVLHICKSSPVDVHYNNIVTHFSENRWHLDW